MSVCPHRIQKFALRNQPPGAIRKWRRTAKDFGGKEISLLPRHRLCVRPVQPERPKAQARKGLPRVDHAPGPRGIFLALVSVLIVSERQSILFGRHVRFCPE